MISKPNLHRDYFSSLLVPDAKHRFPKTGVPNITCGESCRWGERYFPCGRQRVPEAEQTRERLPQKDVLSLVVDFSSVKRIVWIPPSFGAQIRS